MNSVRVLRLAATTVVSRSTIAFNARHLHACAASLSAKNPGPVEQTLRQEVADFKPAAVDASSLTSPNGQKQYSDKIVRLADEIVTLNLIESMDLAALIKSKLGISDKDMAFPSFGGGAPAGGAPAAAPAAAAAEAPAPAKEEKTHVDIKLKGFDQKNKIKVIKEVRGVTNLGLKEAKDLVEAAPCNIMQKVKREEALKIIEKLKAETGAELELV